MALLILLYDDLLLVGKKEQHDEDADDLNERFVLHHLSERDRHPSNGALDQFRVEVLDVFLDVREKFVQLFEN
jgi:hypothetical protein